MTTTIKSELKRRTDLVENPEFREMCANMAKQMGMTVDYWNNNKVQIMLLFANKVCSLENKA